MSNAADAVGGRKEKYLELANILVSNPFFAKTLSFVIDQAEYDAFATALVNFSEHSQTTLLLIKEIVSSEFERNFRTPGSIMRGNCVASKMMGAYSRRIGAQFIKDCIGGHVLSIALDDTLSLEVDPVKLSAQGKSADLEKNIALLNKTAQAIFDSFTSKKMVDAMPDDIKEQAGFVADYARTYCPDRLNPLIGGFLLLRLVNPSLVTPESYGILPEGVKLTSRARRNLTLVSKLLQNLSNKVPFGKKEQYMIPMNAFLDQNQELMDSYLSLVADRAKSIRRKTMLLAQGQKKITSYELLAKKDVLLFHQLLYTYKDKLLEHIQVEVANNRDLMFEEEESFFLVLDELGKPSNCINKVARDVQGMAFLSAALQTGFLTKRKKQKGVIMNTTQQQKQWVVLTAGFMHFFESTQDTRPSKSVSLDEIIVNSSLDEDSSHYFSLTYYRKVRQFVCQTEDEAAFWSQVIKAMKESYSRQVATVATQKLRPIEVRIQNYMMGLKVAYEVHFHGFRAAEAMNIEFQFEVELLGYKYIVSRTFEELQRLHRKLVAAFPKIIFPELPERTVGQPDSPFPLGHYNGRTSFGVVLMCKYLRSYLLEIRSNLQTQQHPLLLEFLDLSCPIRAVMEDRLEQLSSMLQMPQMDFNKHEPGTGHTALHKAVLHDKLEALEWLLCCSGVQASGRDNDGDTPLMLAVRLEKTELVSLLLSRGVDPKTTNNVRNTPLHLAAKRGMVDVCRQLLEKGVRVDDLNLRIRPPMWYAIKHAHVEVVKLLLEWKANVDFEDKLGNTYMIVAAANEQLEVAQLLLDKGFSKINTLGRYQATALHYAARACSLPLVEMLLAAGADVSIRDCCGFSPIYTAALGGATDITDRLIKWSRQKDCLDLEERGEDGSTMAHQAARLDLVSIALLLSKNGADLNAKDQKGRTPVMVASQYNNTNVLKVLLEEGASAVLPDNGRRTPLLVAALKGNLEACQLLVAFQAGLEQADPDGVTPMAAASWAGRLPVVEFLVEANANLNSKDYIDGSTPLMVAVAQRFVKIGLTLVKSGASVDVQRSSDGNTALHLAVDLGLSSLTSFCLSTANCDVSIANSAGQTAKDLAQKDRVMSQLFE